MRTPSADQKRSLRLGGIVFGVVLIALGGPLLFHRWTRAQPSQAGIDDLANRSGHPIPLLPVAKINYPVPESDLHEFLRRLRPSPDEVVSASRWLHLLHVTGPALRHYYHGQEISAVNLFTEADLGSEYFGAAVFSATHHGIRYRASGENLSFARTQEVHRDQVLAHLGELGLSLSTPLVEKGHDYRLYDVLRDSVANFHLAQDELEWTAFAYALYFPPAKQWTNKFGQSFSFDDLALALVDRSLANRPCAGVHVAWALVALYRVDTEHAPILSREVRQRLQRRLMAHVHAAVQSQQPDGSWPTDWHRDPASKDSSRSSASDDDLASHLLATGHVAEWLVYVPPEFEIPTALLTRSADWLYRTLRQLPADLVQDRFCPVSHATHALALMAAEQAVSNRRNEDQ